VNIHHFLPRFYLKGFSVREPRTSVLVYERGKSVPEVRKIKVVAASPGFYVMKDANGQPTELFERFLEKLVGFSRTTFA
jgi:hypothetical protein